MADMAGRGVTPDDDELAEVIRHELMLLDPSVRSSRALVASMLHPDFAEVGASGRIWNAKDVIESLGDVSGDDQVVDLSELAAVRLTDDVALVTYESRRSDRVTLRASVWVRIGSAWKLRYHQGTARAP
jgi:ribonuclease HI